MIILIQNLIFWTEFVGPTLVLLRASCWVALVLGRDVWVLRGFSCCVLIGHCCARFLGLGWLFVTLFVFYEDLAHELRGAGDLLAQLQLEKIESTV